MISLNCPSWSLTQVCIPSRNWSYDPLSSAFWGPGITSCLISGTGVCVCSYIFRHIYIHVQIHVSLHVCGSQRTTSQVSFLKGPSTSPLFLRWAFLTALCHIGHIRQAASPKVFLSLPPKFWDYKYTTTLDLFLNPGDQAQVLVLESKHFTAEPLPQPLVQPNCIRDTV